MVFNAGDDARSTDHSTALSALLRSMLTTTGFSNNAMGDSAMFRNITGAANTAVGDLALENNDATGDGDANFNMAFGARRSSPMLTAVRTTLLAFGLAATATVCSTKPWALWLSSNTLALQTSPLVTRLREQRNRYL